MIQPNRKVTGLCISRLCSIMVYNFLLSNFCKYGDYPLCTKKTNLFWSPLTKVRTFLMLCLEGSLVTMNTRGYTPGVITECHLLRGELCPCLHLTHESWIEVLAPNTIEMWLYFETGYLRKPWRINDVFGVSPNPIWLMFLQEEEISIQTKTTWRYGGRWPPIRPSENTNPAAALI